MCVQGPPPSFEPEEEETEPVPTREPEEPTEQKPKKPVKASKPVEESVVIPEEVDRAELVIVNHCFMSVVHFNVIL